MSERAAPVVSIEFEEERLDNGLEVLLCRLPHVPLVHLSLYYRVGSSYEQPGRSGLAHLFEHMMFEGSERVGKNEHGRLIDAAGGAWNASTSKDRTHYHETLPAHHLERALWLEAERMRSLAITPQNFENQRHTVIEEKKQSYDNQPYGRAHLLFDTLCYRNWAYAHPVIGSIEDLEALSLEEALHFHDLYYPPGNAILVLAGDLPPQALELVRTHFGPIPARPAGPAPDLEEPPQAKERERELEDPLAVLPLLEFGYPMPASGTEEEYALTLLALILGRGESSPLYREFVLERNWLTGLSLGPNRYRGPQLFCLWAQLQHGVALEPVGRALAEALEGAAESAWVEEELERARNQVRHRFVSRLTRVSGIGELLGHYALFFDDPSLINRQLERYLAPGPDQIRKAARRVLQARNRNTLLVRPKQR